MSQERGNTLPLRERQSFLEAAEVSGTLSFFGAICDGKETAQAEEFLGGRSAFLRAKEKFQPTLRSRPRKILAEWQAYMHIETAAFRELVDAARYADMPEFLEAMRMGGEGDVLLPNGNPADGAVRLATLHGAKGLEFPVVFLYGINDKLLPLAGGRRNGYGRGTQAFLCGNHAGERRADSHDERGTFSVSLRDCRSETGAVGSKDGIPAAGVFLTD